MKKIVLCACGIIIAGGFMFLGLPGKPKGNAYSGNETYPGNAKVPASYDEDQDKQSAGVGSLQADSNSLERAMTIQ